jgi:hypothetical protein
MRSTLCILAAMALLSAQAMADPWKDESGHGKRGEYADRDYDRRSGGWCRRNRAGAMGSIS